MSEAPPFSPVAPERADGNEPSFPLRTVLVDDDANFRLLLRYILRRDARFEVVAEAVDGVEGIEAAKVHQPDLMLLDLRMPRLSGEAALPQVLDASPRTRVVILSGILASEAEQKTRALGASGYIEKDGDLTGLGDEVLRVLAGAARQVQ